MYLDTGIKGFLNFNTIAIDDSDVFIAGSFGKTLSITWLKTLQRPFSNNKYKQGLSLSDPHHTMALDDFSTLAVADI